MWRMKLKMEIIAYILVVNYSFDPTEIQEICCIVWAAIYLSMIDGVCVSRQTDQAYFHISKSPGGSVSRWLIGKYIPPPSCFSCNTESLLSLSVSACCSLWSLLYRTWLTVYWLGFTLRMGQLGFFKSPTNQVRFQKMCEIECLPTCEISPLSVDWNVADLLTSFWGKAGVSSTASHWRSSSLACKSMS